MPGSLKAVAGNEPLPDSEGSPPLVQSVRKVHQTEVTTLKNQLLKSHGRPPCTSLSSLFPRSKQVAESSARRLVRARTIVVHDCSVL